MVYQYTIHSTDKYKKLIPNAMLYPLYAYNHGQPGMCLETHINGFMGQDEASMNTIYTFLNDKYMQRMLLVAPPGTGKSTALLGMTRMNTRILVVVPNKSIAMQMGSTFPNGSCVITGDTHNHVDFAYDLYITTPELAESVADAVRKLLPPGIDHLTLVIDEAHEILSGIAAGRSEGVQSVLKAINGLQSEDKLILSTATPEILEGIGTDMCLKVNSERMISSGSFNLHSCKITNNRITRVTAFADQLSKIYKDTGCPGFVFFNKKKDSVKLADKLTAMGYHVLLTNSGDRSVMDIIRDSGCLPNLMKDRYGLTVPVDFIICTSVIQAGVSIQRNPAMGDRQYVPVVICDSHKSFDISNVIQFFTRTRYDVSGIHFIKTFYTNVHNEGQYDLTTASFQKLREQINGMVAQAVQGSLYARNYKYNCDITGSDSFLEDRHFIDDLTYFDRNKNHLEADLFAIRKCAWDNYNQRLFLDSNADAAAGKESLFTAMSDHLCLKEYIYSCEEYDNSRSRLDGLDKDKERELRQQRAQYRLELGKSILREKSPIEAIFKCTNNPLVKQFRNEYRDQLATLEQMYIIGDTLFAEQYLHEMVHGTQKSRSERKHQIITTALILPRMTAGRMVSPLSLCSLYEHVEEDQMNLGDAMLKKTIMILKNTEEYHEAAKMYLHGYHGEYVEKELKNSRNVHEQKIRNKANRYMEAALDNIDIARTSCMGQEIRLVMNKLVYAKNDNTGFRNLMGDTVTFPVEQLDSLAQCLQDCVTWKHAKRYTAKTVIRIISSIAEAVKVNEDGSISAHLPDWNEWNQRRLKQTA